MDRVDVWVLGFVETARPTAGMMSVFELDEPAALELMAKLPCAVKQDISMADATVFLRALNGIGARVELRSPAARTLDAKPPMSPKKSALSFDLDEPGQGLSGEAQAGEGMAGGELDLEEEEDDASDFGLQFDEDGRAISTPRGERIPAPVAVAPPEPVAPPPFAPRAGLEATPRAAPRPPPAAEPEPPRPPPAAEPEPPTSAPERPAPQGHAPAPSFGELDLGAPLDIAPPDVARPPPRSPATAPPSPEPLPAVRRSAPAEEKPELADDFPDLPEDLLNEPAQDTAAEMSLGGGGLELGAIDIQDVPRRMPRRRESMSSRPPPSGVPAPPPRARHRAAPSAAPRGGGWDLFGRLGPALLAMTVGAGCLAFGYYYQETSCFQGEASLFALARDAVGLAGVAMGGFFVVAVLLGARGVFDPLPSAGALVLGYAAAYGINDMRAPTAAERAAMESIPEDMDEAPGARDYLQTHPQSALVGFEREESEDLVRRVLNAGSPDVKALGIADGQIARLAILMPTTSTSRLGVIGALWRFVRQRALQAGVTRAALEPGPGDAWWIVDLRFE